MNYKVIVSLIIVVGIVLMGGAYVYTNFQVSPTTPTSGSVASTQSVHTIHYSAPTGWSYSKIPIADMYSAPISTYGEPDAKIHIFNSNVKPNIDLTASMYERSVNFKKENITMGGATGYKVTYDDIISGNGISYTKHNTVFILVKDNKEYDIDGYYVEGVGNIYVSDLNKMYDSVVFN